MQHESHQCISYPCELTHLWILIHCELAHVALFSLGQHSHWHGTGDLALQRNPAVLAIGHGFVFLAAD